MKTICKNIGLFFFIGLILISCTNDLQVNAIEEIENNMVLVHGGTYTMGCREQVAPCFQDEWPPHQVTLSDYYIGKFEVTQEIWKGLMGSNPSHIKGSNLPVDNVSRKDIQEFIQKLNRLTGRTYRLPTDAEWEFAARGGILSNSFIYAGSNINDQVAWYENNSELKPHPVGTKLPNELGIYDMCGNVSEFCSDWFGYYSFSSQTNPQGPNSSIRGHVLRGGFWRSNSLDCILSKRWSDLGEGCYYWGFRLCRDL